jgi:hypothetical protein
MNKMRNNPTPSNVQFNQDLNEISLPTNHACWPPLLAPANICLKTDQLITTINPNDRSQRKLIRELEAAISDASAISGYSLSDRLRSTLNYYIAGQPTKTNPDRQTQTALILAQLVDTLNKKGITPKLLEVGAGPSFSPLNDFNYQPPWASRLLGIMNNKKILQAQIFCADPALMPQIESYYGLKAFNAKIEIRPDATVGQLADILLNSDNQDFLLHLHKRGSQSFIEGYLLDLYHEHMQRQIDPTIVDAKQAIFISYPVGILLLTAHTWFNKKSFPDDYQTCEQHYGENLLTRRHEAAIQSRHPDPDIAKKIVDNAPYDIIFGQQTPTAPQRFMALAANGGRIYQFPECNLATAPYAKQIWHTTA